VSGGPIPRVGAARSAVVEIPLDQLIPLHPVPRPIKPANYLADLANQIRQNGYRLDRPVVALRMPDGRLVIGGGHHRVAAMRLLGQATIPARVVDWTSVTPSTQDWYRDNFPGVFP
jgi:ParB-like chromosome segregation protein Spo0J